MAPLDALPQFHTDISDQTGPCPLSSEQVCKTWLQTITPPLYNQVCVSPVYFMLVSHSMMSIFCNVIYVELIRTGYVWLLKHEIQSSLWLPKRIHMSPKNLKGETMLNREEKKDSTYTLQPTVTSQLLNTTSMSLLRNLISTEFVKYQ